MVFERRRRRRRRNTKEYKEDRDSNSPAEPNEAAYNYTMRQSKYSTVERQYNANQYKIIAIKRPVNLGL